MNGLYGCYVIHHFGCIISIIFENFQKFKFNKNIQQNSRGHSNEDSNGDLKEDKSAKLEPSILKYPSDLIALGDSRPESQIG